MILSCLKIVKILIRGVNLADENINVFFLENLQKSYIR